jgi:putative acetyltransferase
VHLQPVPYADVLDLATAMSDEMSALYEDDEGASPASPADFDAPGIFLRGTVDDQPVAIGGLRLLAPGRGEVKRMYVVPAHRGRGHSRTLLRGLLEHARAVGLTEVWLETGVRQPEAIALYASEGFTPIPPYGHFAAHPESRCFGLRL